MVRKLSVISSLVLATQLLDAAAPHDVVYIKGESMSCMDVLRQVQAQTDYKFSVRVEDSYGYRQDYDHHVSVEKVLKSLGEYFEEFNNEQIEVVDRGHGKLILERKKDELPVAAPPSPMEETMLITSGSMTAEYDDLDKLPGIGVIPPSKKTVDEAKLQTPIFEGFVIVEQEEESSQASRRAKRRRALSRMSHKKEDVMAELESVVADAQEKPEVEADKLEAETGTALDAESYQEKKALVKELEGQDKGLVELEDIVTGKAPVAKTTTASAKSTSKPHFLSVEVLGDKHGDLDPSLFQDLDEKADSVVGSSKISEVSGKSSDEPLWKKLLYSTATEYNDSVSMGQMFSGAQSGFMAPPQLASNPQAEGLTTIGVSFAYYEEGKDRAATGESIEGGLAALRLSAEHGLASDLVLKAELPLGGHSGDFELSGAGENDLAFSFGELNLGVHYYPDVSTLKYGRIVTGAQLKLPTGSDDDLMGTGKIDGGVFAAYHLQADSYLAFMQVGASLYGDRAQFDVSEAGGALSFSLGLNYRYSSELSFEGAFLFSQSPYSDAKDMADFYADDISVLRFGSSYQYKKSRFMLGIDCGLSESASDLGVQLVWEKDIN
ncbi:MAG: DUF3187 family protein [Planctomycetes bacterium]|nr:DUF3187 family protein [Planctomycetota bacterium]